MNVTTLRRTPEPEKLVVQTARGDYHDGFVPETAYSELIDDAEYDEDHVEQVDEIIGDRLTVRDEVLYKQYALLERLMRKRHFGPFEHPTITVGIEGISVVTERQLTRHRLASFDVQSMRYVNFAEKDDAFRMPKSLTDSDHATRHGSVDVDGREGWKSVIDLQSDSLMNIYRDLTEAGVPEEDARFILPMGTTVNLSMTLNARMLLHLEEMRGKADAQWEIRELTEEIHEEFVDWMPMSAKIYEDSGPFGVAP